LSGCLISFFNLLPTSVLLDQEQNTSYDYAASLQRARPAY
jgi:hypothetical protein